MNENHHYKNRGDFMNTDILWELFKRTGDIKYYHLWCQIIKK